MSIAEKLTQIAKNQQRVYEAGYVRGRNSNAYDEGYMQCAQDVDLATQMPFFLTPFEATPWYSPTVKNSSLEVKDGVLYRRFNGKLHDNNPTYGVSVTLIANKNNDDPKHIDGQYLVFKMKTNYGGDNMVGFTVEIGIDCAPQNGKVANHRACARNDKGDYEGSGFVPRDKWAVYVIPLGEVCGQYGEGDQGQYPGIRTAGIAFYSFANYACNHDKRYVDLAYSAVCATPDQVANLIKNDTAFLWDQSNRKWTTEFDFSPELNEQNKILEEV